MRVRQRGVGVGLRGRGGDQTHAEHTVAQEAPATRTSFLGSEEGAATGGH